MAYPTGRRYSVINLASRSVTGELRESAAVTGKVIQ